MDFSQGHCIVRIRDSVLGVHPEPQASGVTLMFFPRNHIGRLRERESFVVASV